MKNTGINPVVIKEIRQMAQQCGLVLVILFGSRARGDFSKVSDIDLAVTGGNTARFALDIEETSTLLCFDVVDLDKPVQKELRQASFWGSSCRSSFSLFFSDKTHPLPFCSGGQYLFCRLVNVSF